MNNDVYSLIQISIAIESYQNEILEYLLDNYFPQSEDDFESMDYSKRRKRENDAFKNNEIIYLDLLSMQYSLF